MGKDIIEELYNVDKVLNIPFVGLGLIGEKLVVSFEKDDMTTERMSCFTEGHYTGNPSIRLQAGERFIVATRAQRQALTVKPEALSVERRYLSVKECAVYTGVSVKTLYRWSRESKVPTSKIGHILRFDRAEIEKWVGRYKRSATNADLLD